MKQEKVYIKSARTFFFFLCLWHFSILLLAQEPLIRNLNTNHGLSGNECYRVIQDKQGYIWVASDAGLSRYNGYTFENFSKKDSLPDNVILHLFQDKKGRIWVVGLNRKISYFERNSFHPLKKYNVIAAGLPIKTIVISAHINEKEELKLGYGAAYPNILTYNLATNNIVSVRKYGKNQLLAEIDEKGNFVYGAWHAPVSNEKPGISVNILRNNKPCLKEGVKQDVFPNLSCYVPLHANRFLLSMQNVLFMCRDSLLIPLYTYKGSILSMFKDHEDRIWVMEQNNGVHLWCAKGDSLISIQHWYKDITFTSATEDRENNVWLTSLHDGVYLIPNTHIHNYNIREETGSNVKVLTACMFSGDLLIAGNSPWIYRFDKSTGAFRHYAELSVPSDSPFHPEVFSLQNWHKKLLVVGLPTSVISTDNNRVKLLAIRDKRQHYNSVPGFRRFTIASPSNADDLIYVGSSGAILPIHRNDDLSNLLRENIALPLRLRSLYQDTIHNTLYIGCENGLYTWAGGKATPLGHYDPLLKERINYINKYRDVFLLSTKERGVLVWKDKVIKIYDKNNGLLSNDCRKTEVDPLGNLWIATAAGISRISNWLSDQPKANSFARNEGLASSEISSFTINGDEIWIPNNTGVTCLKASLSNETRPPVYITSIALGDSLYTNTFPAEVPYKHNLLRIRFNGLSYRNNSGLEYRYRLLGLDTTWQTSKTPYVEFASLPPGEYHFEVIAIKNLFLSSERPASYKFVIYPPFYLRAWFIVLVSLLVFGSIYLYFALRFKRLRKREEERSRFQMKIQETEMKALKAQTNPHFIFNALNSIRLFIMQNKSEEAQHYLMQFTYLMRQVLENSEKDIIPISVEFSVLERYIELEALRFMGKFSSEVHFPEKDRGENYLIPPLLLQPIVENAIWHGLMPLEERPGKLKIGAFQQNNSMVIYVEDNGIGRKKSAELKAGKTKHKTSMGMTITEDRINLFNLKHKSTIGIAVIDVYDESGQANGTRTEITLT